MWFLVRREVVGPWLFRTWLNISSRNKIRRKMKALVICWFLFFHMTKFQLFWCGWRREIKVCCWQVGQFVFLEVSTFAACLLSLGINNYKATGRRAFSEKRFSAFLFVLWTLKNITKFHVVRWPWWNSQNRRRRPLFSKNVLKSSLYIFTSTLFFFIRRIHTKVFVIIFIFF